MDFRYISTKYAREYDIFCAKTIRESRLYKECTIGYDLHTRVTLGDILRHKDGRTIVQNEGEGRYLQ